MKSTNLISTIISVFIFAVFFQSCSDDSQVINTASPINVSGKVVGLVNQGVGGLQISRAGELDSTEDDGSFSFSHVYPPYQLRIIKDSVTYFINDISAANIRIPDFSSIDNNRQANIAVTIPNEIFQPVVTGKIMFTDGNYVNAYGAPGSPVTIYLPDNVPVTGKLIVLTYKKDGAGNIISYENFGESAPIQVSIGDNLTYNFTLNELSLNPGEESISGHFAIPAGFLSEPQFFYLTFSSKLTRSFLSLVEFSAFTGDNFNLKIPTGLPISYSTLVGNSISNSSINSQTLESFSVPSNSSGITLENKIPPTLVSPPDGAVVSDPLTNFTFTSENGSGVFIVRFTNTTSGKEFVFITDKNFLNLVDGIGMNNFSNSSFVWTVEKTGPTNNINDYLSSFSEQVGSFRTYSRSRSFSTP